MLKKLFIQDMRSMNKQLIPFTIIMAICTLVTTGAVKLIVEILSKSSGFPMILTALITLAFFGFLFVFVFLVSGLICVYVRFYKNLFTDQGYLTFTLPVKTSEIILSKFLAGFVWSIIIFLLFVLSVLFFITFGTAGPGNIIRIINIRAILDFFGLFSISNTHLAFMSLEVIIFGFVYTAEGIFLGFLSVTLGSIIAQKHKIITSLLIYYAITAFSSSIFSLLLFPLTEGLTLIDISVVQPTTLFYIAFGIGIAVYVGISIGVYYIIRYLLKNKLNLL